MDESLRMRSAQNKQTKKLQSKIIDTLHFYKQEL